jgi:hypothetical protein
MPPILIRDKRFLALICSAPPSLAAPDLAAPDLAAPFPDVSCLEEATYNQGKIRLSSTVICHVIRCLLHPGEYRLP